MKPRWRDAPEWAQWLAQDEDGHWYWYEKKPIATEGEIFMALEGLDVMVRFRDWSNDQVKAQSSSLAELIAMI